MKKQSFKAIAKKASVISIATVLLLLSSNNIMALPEPHEVLKPVQITYAGRQDNILAFSVNYNNVTGDKFDLELYNEDHELLYQRRYNDKVFKTKIYLTKQAETCKVTFTIRSGKKAYSQTFEINSQTKFVEDFIVKNL